MDVLTPSFVSVSKNFIVLIHKMGPIVFTLPVLMVSSENKKISKHLVNHETPSKFRILWLFFLKHYFTLKYDIKIREI